MASGDRKFEGRMKGGINLSREDEMALQRRKAFIGHHTPDFIYFERDYWAKQRRYKRPDDFHLSDMNGGACHNRITNDTFSRNYYMDVERERDARLAKESRRERRTDGKNIKRWRENSRHWTAEESRKRCRENPTHLAAEEDRNRCREKQSHWTVDGLPYATNFSFREYGETAHPSCSHDDVWLRKHNASVRRNPSHWIAEESQKRRREHLTHWTVEENRKRWREKPSHWIVDGLTHETNCSTREYDEIIHPTCSHDDAWPQRHEASFLKRPNRRHKEENDISSSKDVNTMLGDISASSPRASIRHDMKKLLILDLNGLLVDVVDDPQNSQKPTIRVGRKSVFKRPFCDEFLRFCFERFYVGIWSSRMKRNADAIIEILFGEQRHVLLFCWSQSECTPTGFKTIENADKPLVLKELKRLWNNQDCILPWKPGRFSASNTLLIDDSPYKALCNPRHTGIFPKPYSYKNSEDCSLGLGGDLRAYLEGLAEADNVQEYVSLRPFGQPPISPRCPSWDFYLTIIKRMTNHVSCFAD